MVRKGDVVKSIGTIGSAGPESLAGLGRYVDDAWKQLKFEPCPPGDACAEAGGPPFRVESPEERRRRLENGRIRSISFERISCLRLCPRYKVELQGNGKATYLGRPGAERVGTFRADLDRAELERLADIARDVGFFRLEDSYCAEWEEAELVVSVSLDSGRKTVESCSGAPPAALEKLVDRLDQFQGQLEWEPFGRPNRGWAIP